MSRTATGNGQVETIGDAYMVVAGHDGAPDHSERLLALSADMLKAAERVQVIVTNPLSGFLETLDGLNRHWPQNVGSVMMR